MGEASPAIELHGVSLQFEEHEPLLANVNLKISRGEKFVVIGPSGHGKSVLLKLMAGILRPTRGHVKIDGVELNSVSERERQKLILKMGMLFQKNALFDSLTAAENIAFPLRETRNMPETEIQNLIDRFLNAVGLSHARDLYPDEISGGMQKRLGIARALALDPEIIFYDDPTAGLDPITSRKIVDLICELQRSRDSTVVAITNDMNRAYQMADRIAMVVDGELIVTGDRRQTEAHRDPRVQQFIRGELTGPLTVTP